MSDQLALRGTLPYRGQELLLETLWSDGEVHYGTLRRDLVASVRKEGE